MNPQDHPTSYDVIVIGGGPAGATAAALLAEHGRRVLVLEKEAFPRYHIGESLLPYCYFTLDRLGLIDTLNRSRYVKKYSVQFVTVEGRQSLPFYFFQHMDHAAAQTWQVVRSSFDQLLLDTARRRGAAVVHGLKVERLIVEDHGVVGVATTDAENQRRTFRATMTIDASGRDAVSLNQFNWRVPDGKLKKMAVWTYYRGAVRDPGRDEGATTVAYLPGKGWFWYIPLPDDIVSVGIVAEKDYLFAESKDPATIIRSQIGVNPWITEHLAPAQQVGRCYVTGEFTYRSRHCATDGLLLAGDAFAFLDPVFSSGVFLALRSGAMAADAIHDALDAGDVSAQRFTEYGRQYCQGLEAMRKLVYAFYDQAFSFGKLLKQNPDLHGPLTDCLIGNLYRDFEPLFDAVAQFADVPAPLPHGGPRILAQ